MEKKPCIVIQTLRLPCFAVLVNTRTVTDSGQVDSVAHRWLSFLFFQFTGAHIWQLHSFNKVNHINCYHSKYLPHLTWKRTQLAEWIVCSPHLFAAIWSTAEQHCWPWNTEELKYDLDLNYFTSPTISNYMSINTKGSQIRAFCFYWNFIKCPNYFGIGVVYLTGLPHH